MQCLFIDPLRRLWELVMELAIDDCRCTDLDPEFHEAAPSAATHKRFQCNSHVERGAMRVLFCSRRGHGDFFCAKGKDYADLRAMVNLCYIGVCVLFHAFGVFSTLLI